jgi:long-chain acyl-CoA synthetase
LVLSVPLLIEKLYRQSILPTFQSNRIYKVMYASPVGRRILNRMAGRKMRVAFGGRLYFFGIGGAPPSPDIEDFLREAHFPYCVGYGLTETSPVLAAAHPRDMLPRSTGKPLEGIEIRIDDQNSGTAEGEILVKGPVVMQGYYKDTELTSRVIDSDGWFHTGDLGSLDRKGYLYIRGRVKTMILGPSGEKIYPEAVESVINSFDFVEDSLVFQHKGQLFARIHLNYEGFLEHIQSLAESAVGVPRDIGSYLTELRKSVNESLSSFSRIGRFIEQTEPFEKTPTQKIKRFLYDTLHIPDPLPEQSAGESLKRDN